MRQRIEAAAMNRPTQRKKQAAKRVLRLPDLDYAKRAVLNTLGSRESTRAYEFAINDFIAWYCSEPRLAFSRTVVLRYRIELENRHLAASTINLRSAAVLRLAFEAADTGLLRGNKLRHRFCMEFLRCEAGWRWLFPGKIGSVASSRTRLTLPSLS
jgi:hypothetical protein